MPPDLFEDLPEDVLWELSLPPLDEPNEEDYDDYEPDDD